ncbi:MAG TPA: O-antigen polysaccharide polymerase Wzy, partial [Oligoflexia bacterium]|nr:O-antigen polysaccharide polymerase Wzy [Oligoflexia bacterium]
LSFQAVFAVGSWWFVTSRVFDPYVLFLLCATLFNAGHAFLEVVNAEYSGLLGGRFSDMTVAKTLFYCLAALSVLHLGALLARCRDAQSSNTNETANLERACCFVGLLLLAISAFSTFLMLRNLLMVTGESGYIAMFDREKAVGFSAAHRVMMGFFAPGMFILAVGTRKHRCVSLFLAVLMLAFALAMFTVGSRWQGGMPLVAFAWLWHRSIKRLPPFALVFAGAVMVFLLFPAIALLRKDSGIDRYSIAAFGDALAHTSNPAIAAVEEMGRSMATVAHTLELVPDVRPFDHGRSYLWALFTVMPGVFWDLHPTTAAGVPSAWLVETVSPWTAARGGGLGYSFIAEAYLNFGLLGGLAAIALTGFLFSSLFRWAEHSGNVVNLVLIGCMLPPIMFYSRSEAALLVRYLTWYALIPYFMIHVWCRLLRRSS